MWWWLACAAPEPETRPALPSPPLIVDIGRARIVATGDAMMHGGVKAAAKTVDHRLAGRSINAGGYRDLFQAVAPRIAAADLAFVNLEFPVAPTTSKGTRSLVFDAPPAVLDALVATGFDVVSFANNHVYDQGRAGFVETLDHLDAVPLRYAGAGRSCNDAYAPVMTIANGIWIAWIAATEVQNDWLNEDPDRPCVALLDTKRIIASAEAARREGADIVVLSLHWGIEYETQPMRTHHVIAHELVERGIDVLLGHHPHVLQPVERVRTLDGRDTIIAYSLGNFISNQAFDFNPARHPVEDGNQRDGVLVEIEFVKRRYPHGGEPIVATEIADVELIPLWTRNDRDEEPPISVEISTERRAHALSVLEAPIQWPEPTIDQRISRM